MVVDVMIKGGLIVDGSGNRPFPGNVAVRAGKITGVGDVRETAARVIDATGLAVAPGFWDMHTHYDAQLLWDPIATSSCWHGITTVVTGNCGFTIAPCRRDDQDWICRMLGRVESMNVDVLKATLPWPWETFGQYLDTLDRGLGVNVVPQVGHSAIRRYVMGAEASQRVATPEELRKMKQVLAESLKAGGMGFTTSRSVAHWDGDGLPVPSRKAAYDEYMALVSELSAIDAGFIEMVGDDFNHVKESTLKNLVDIQRATGRPVCFNEIVQRADNAAGWKHELETIQRYQREGVRFFGLGSTQPNDFEFTFQFTDVFNRWPTWQKIFIQPKDKIVAHMKDAALREALKKEMAVDPGPRLPTNWQRIIMVRSATGKYRQFEMQRVADIGAKLGKHPQDAAFDIALDEDLKTHFRLLDSKNAEEHVWMEVLKSPHIAAGMTDAGAHLLTQANTGYATNLLGHWVREKGAISLEAAVRSLTAVPAEESDVTDRGFIREGLAADITIFDPATVRAKDRVMMNDLPQGAPRWVQYSEGIEYSIVNGQVTMEHGKHTGALGGKTLRSTAYSKRG